MSHIKFRAQDMFVGPQVLAKFYSEVSEVKLQDFPQAEFTDWK
jgi:hypothetical protein